MVRFGRSGKTDGIHAEVGVHHDGGAWITVAIRQYDGVAQLTPQLIDRSRRRPSDVTAQATASAPMPTTAKATAFLISQQPAAPPLAAVFMAISS